MATSPPVPGKDRPSSPVAAAGVEPEKGSPSEPGLSPLFVTNLLALLGVGVAFCAWILHYTEWFPAIGGILALGGVLSWLAFVSRVLPGHRTRALQTWADRAILCSRTTLTVLVLVTAFGLTAASFLGTVQVESVRESTDRFLRAARVSVPLFFGRARAGVRKRASRSLERGTGGRDREGPDGLSMKTRRRVVTHRRGGEP